MVLFDQPRQGARTLIYAVRIDSLISRGGFVVWYLRPDQILIVRKRFDRSEINATISYNLAVGAYQLQWHIEHVSHHGDHGVHEGQGIVSNSADSRFMGRVVEMLKRELAAHSPRIKQEATGVRCAIPQVGAFLIVHVTDRRVYWETVPAALNDSRDIKTDADWDTTYSELEGQVIGWVATL